MVSSSLCSSVPALLPPTPAEPGSPPNGPAGCTSRGLFVLVPGQGLGMPHLGVPRAPHGEMAVSITKWVDRWTPSPILALARARPEVLTCTSWGAPIIWDGTFDPDVAQQEAIQQNLTIGLTVFAVGR